MAKLKLTNDLIKDAGDYMAAGLYDVDVYTILGVSQSSWYSWLKLGQEAAEKEWPKKNAIYRKFYEHIQKAKIYRELKHLEIIDKAGEKDWRASAEYLKLTRPKRYKTGSVEIAGPDGGPIPVDYREVTELSDEELMALAAQGLRIAKKPKGKGTDG